MKRFHKVLDHGYLACQVHNQIDILRTYIANTKSKAYFDVYTCTADDQYSTAKMFRDLNRWSQAECESSRETDPWRPVCIMLRTFFVTRIIAPNAQL